MLKMKKKIAKPQTVLEAIAPFKQVQDNLLQVMARQSARAEEARRRITDAKDYAEQVEKDESTARALADEQIGQAKKIADSLSALLGE